MVRTGHKAIATYQKVLDGRKQPIRGLWRRNYRYYARLKVDDPDGGDRKVRRITVTSVDALMRC